MLPPTITLDIETIPGQAPGLREELAAAVKPPGTFKKAESIAAWFAENREAEAEQAWLATSLDGGLGQVCVIGYAVDDAPPVALAATDLSAASERDLLMRFFSTAPITVGGKWVGHNILGFDLRFLWHRAMVHGVQPPFPFPHPERKATYDGTVADTMTMWAGYNGRISLDRLCRILGLPGKGGMDGSKVWPMVRDGRMAEVAAYCAADVQRHRAVYRRMTFASAAPTGAAP